MTPSKTLSDLDEVITQARDILLAAPELNMANYSWEQVRDLNNAAIETYLLLDEAITAWNDRANTRSPIPGTGQESESSETVTAWVAEAFGATDNEFRRVARGNEEMAELITKIASDAPTDEITEEAADVAILLHLICGRRGRDLNAEIDRKMAINRSRKWAVDATGCGYHVKEQSHD